MDYTQKIDIGTCTYGPVILSASTVDEMKHAISIINYTHETSTYLISCKTTSSVDGKIWDGEFVVDNLFGRGPSKIQPYNVVRIPKDKLPSHRHVGKLHASVLPKFELGLKITIKQGLLDSKESLALANSWQNFFSIPTE